MNRKALVMVVIVAALSMAGVAGSADTPADASYFEGVWSGSWDMGQAGQDVTVTVGEKNEKGSHKTTYDYGCVKSATGGSIAPGSFVVYGREQGGVFTTWWKNSGGRKEP